MSRQGNGKVVLLPPQLKSVGRLMKEKQELMQRVEELERECAAYRKAERDSHTKVKNLVSPSQSFLLYRLSIPLLSGAGEGSHGTQEEAERVE